jgi:spermidine synthase
MRLDEALTASAGVYFEASARLVHIQSPYQCIEVFDTPDLGRLMRIDGVNMTSERDEFFYHEALIHPAATAHPNPTRALIIGGGDGGSSEEMLKHVSIEACQLYELDEAVVRVSREWLPAVHRGVFEHPKLALTIGDGIEGLSALTEQVDLIYLDLTDPVGSAEALYQATFFAECHRALADGGALVLHLGSAFMHADRVRRHLQDLRRVYQIVTPYFVHIPTYGATWSFAVASDSLNIANVTTAMLDERLLHRGVQDRQLYTGAVHHAMLAQAPYMALK